MTWSRSALHFSPDAAILLLTLGVLLVYVELNRPGAILPGALGLTLLLLSIASLLRFDLSATGLVLVLTAGALLLLDLLRPTPPLVAAAATLALCLGLGLDKLVAPVVAAPARVRLHALVALPCGLVLGVGTSVLTRIARRARANKAVD